MKRSLWQDNIKLPEFPPLCNETKTDVLIIGGGIAGILTAYFLKQKGIKYILAEKGRICGGTTSDTTAKITFQHGLLYNKLQNKCGTEKAQGYLRANMLAAKKYAELCEEIDCDYEKKDNYVYSLDDRRKIENEAETLLKLGCSAEVCDRISLPMDIAGAVKIADQAQFHPLKFISYIAPGLNIFENTFVREMIGTTAITDRAKIKAEKVIVATHFPFINKHGSYFLKLYQHRSYVMALKNAPNVQGMYVDENKKGMSFRNYGEYLLIGGGGHRTGKQGGNWSELKNFARVNYPMSKEAYYWSAQDCMSLDNMPYIGRYSKNTPQLFVASGFNKWGITGSMTAAMLLCDIITDSPNDFAEVFSPSRSIIKPQLAINGFEAVTNLLTPSKKRCPHLGCALKWNSAEHSWDCPCHGSRFSESGKVLDNPANGNISI